MRFLGKGEFLGDGDVLVIVAELAQLGIEVISEKAVRSPPRRKARAPRRRDKACVPDAVQRKREAVHR